MAVCLRALLDDDPDEETAIDGDAALNVIAEAIVKYLQQK